MAFNPLDYLKNLVPQNTNMFGASPNANMKKMAEMGLLGDTDYTDMLAKANKQSIFQGLLGAGLSYAAQPKNQGYGSIFPYLAKAGLAGVQAAQNPYDQMGKDAMMNQKLQEMQRAKGNRELSDNFLSTWGQPNTGEMKIDASQTPNIATSKIPSLQDYTIGSSLMNGVGYNPKMLPNGQIAPTEVAPNFNTINQMDSETKKTLFGDTPNPSIKQLMDSGLLGADGGLSFLTSNNDLQKKYTGKFDPMLAIDAAVRNKSLPLDKALAMKASIAAANSKNEFGSADSDNLIYNKRTGEIVSKGSPKENFTILDENQIQAYEKANKLEVGSTRRIGKDGLPITYQINKDSGKVSILGGGGGGVNVTTTVGAENQASKLNVFKNQEDLNKTMDSAKLAYKNLPRVRAAYNLTSQAPTGAFANELTDYNAFMSKVRGKGQYKEYIASLRAATSGQDMKALLGGDVFPLIKILGIGARGLDTPAEREFLISVMTGQATMTEAALKSITARRLRQSDDTIQEYNNLINDGAYTQAGKDWMAATGASTIGDRYSPLTGDTYEGLTTLGYTGEELRWSKFKKPQVRNGREVTSGWGKWQEIK